MENTELSKNIQKTIAECHKIGIADLYGSIVVTACWIALRPQTAITGEPRDATDQTRSLRWLQRRQGASSSTERPGAMVCIGGDGRRCHDIESD
jgi:hypothetical protein